MAVVVAKRFPIGDQVAGIFGVDGAIAADRSRRVSGVDGVIEKDFLRGRAALLNGVEVSIFVGAVDYAVGVDGDGVGAPFESVGMLLGDGGVLKLPLGNQIRIELSDVVRARRRGRTPSGIVAIGAAVVVIVFGDDGIGAVVGKDGGGGIPTEVVVREVDAGGVEFEEMSAAVVDSRR